MNQRSLSLEPTVGSVLGYGWQVMKRYFLPLLVVVLILSLVEIPLSFSREGHEMTPGMYFLMIFGLAYLLFVRVPVRFGADYVFLLAVRNRNFEVREMFSGFNNYMNVVLAGLLSGALIGIGIFLFIIPGIILACRFAFVPYLVMDKNLDPVKAVEESWRLTKGYGWRIFGLGLLSILIYIAGLVVMFVGVLISMMWVHVAFAAMYQGVLEERGEYKEMAENSNNQE